MRHSLTLGYCVLTLAQAALSVNVVTSKFLVGSLPMFFILAARFGLSTILLAGLMKLTNTAIISPFHPTQKLTPYDWFLGFLQGIFAAVLFNVFFLWGLQHTTATASGIVASTLPAIITISALFFLKERLTNGKVIALLLAMLGILIINLDHFDGNSQSEHTYFGDLLVFIAMLPEAWYSIVSRKLADRITPLGAAFLANLVGFVSFIPCALLTCDYATFANVTLVQWLFVSLAGVASLLFFWSWGWGLSFIPASTAAIFGGVMPIATTLLAVVFLSENIQWYDALGIVLVISSIFISTGWPTFKKSSSRLEAFKQDNG